jgi:hypothetical protein
MTTSTRHHLATQVVIRTLIGVCVAIVAYLLTTSAVWAAVALLATGFVLNLANHPGGPTRPAARR